MNSTRNERPRQHQDGPGEPAATPRRTWRGGIAGTVVLIALALATGLTRAAETQIQLDGQFSDWEGVDRHADPIGDDLHGHHDLAAIAVHHDPAWLCLLVELDRGDGDFYGNSNRVEQVVVYLDTDHDAATGFRVGPEGHEIGAEFALVSSRRVSTRTGSEGTLYRGGDPWYGNPRAAEEAVLIGNVSGNRGLPRVEQQEAVHAFETGVPLDAIGLAAGGRLAIAVRAGRSGTGAQTDWLDRPLSVAVPPPVHLGTLRWRSPTLEYRLSAPDEGMGLVGLRHIGLDRAFLRVPDRADAARLWSIALTANPADPAAQISVSNTTPAQHREARAEDGLWTLTWQGVALPDQSTIDVVVRCRPGAATGGLDDWRIEVTNHSTTFGILQTCFPTLELGVIGDSGEDDTIILAPAEGRSLRNPIAWGLDKAGPQINTDITTDNVAIETPPGQVDFGGFGAARPHGLPYPGGRGQMQLAAYYEKTGDAYYPDVRPGAGLYLATHDDALYPKLIFCTPQSRRGALLFEIAHHPDDSARPGLAHRPPYPVVLGGFTGDWYDATQLYRQWAVTARWSRPGPLAGREDVPTWLKEMTAMIRADVRKADQETVLPLLAPMREALAGTLGIQWYFWSAWEKRPDTTGYAFPARPEGPPGFEAIVAGLQAQAMAVFPYMNTRLWNDGEGDEVTPWLMRRQSGETFHEGHAAHPCVQTAFWQDYLTKACRELAQRYAPMGIYLDQGAEAQFGGHPNWQGCHHPDHGHPRGVTRDMVQAEYDRVERIYRAAREARPDVVLCGEGNAECFNDIVSNKLIHYEIWPGAVPLFAAVYHDYVTAYGRTALLVGKDPSDPIPAMRIGWQLAMGNQIGRVWTGAIGAQHADKPHYAEHLDYLRRATVVRQRFPAFLCVGRMLRPPFVDGALPTITTNEFLRLDHRVTLPAAVGSTWQAADGSLGVLWTNMSRQTVELVFWIDPALAPGKALERAYDDGGMAADTALGPQVRRIALPPLGIAFYTLR